MGRHQITGNEFCPYPTCESLNLGRLREKMVRSRNGSRYIKRYYFQHNDKTIREHYVDNFVRKERLYSYETHPFGKFIKSLDELADNCSKLDYGLNKAGQQMNKFQMTEEENKNLKNCFNDMKQEIEFLSLAFSIKNLILKYRLQEKRIPKTLIQTEAMLKKISSEFIEMNTLVGEINAIVTGMGKDPNALWNQVNPLGSALNSVYSKYEFPKRREKFKQRGKDLSKWPLQSKKSGQFTGIENC